ncbi:MAG: hypothetical protein Fur0025_44640 [Oscillatoriaceae cyanobacterium]
MVNSRYQLIQPLRPPNPALPTEIFTVKDWDTEEAEAQDIKVMKVLKYTHNRDLLRLFKQEARVLMWLRHPAIPQADPDGYFRVTTSQGRQLQCLVMTYLAGENVEPWLTRNGPISSDRAWVWLHQLAQILERLHREGIYHRDIKPGNLIVMPDRGLALVDFGSVGCSHRGTTPVGTSGYGAPEQLAGQGVPESDFFALGRTFVYLLSGKSPLHFATQMNTGRLLWREVVRVSESLGDVIDQLMAPTPEQRPRTARGLVELINRQSLCPEAISPEKIRDFTPA